MIILSYSSMTSLDSCPYAFWVHSIKRWHPYIPADETGVVPGKVCHKLAELFFQGGGKDWGIWDREFGKIFTHYITKSTVYLGDKAFAKDVNSAERFCLKCRDNLVDELHTSKFAGPFFSAEGRIGEVETPFEVIPGVGLIGGWDLLTGISEKSPLLLVDFKASDSDYYLSGKQLDVYALAIELKLGLHIANTAFLLFKKKKNRLIINQYGQENRDKTLDWIRRCKVKVESGSFLPCPSKFSCHLCEFKGVCKFVYHEPENHEEGLVPFIPQAF